MRRSVHKTSHDLLRESLRDDLVAAVESRHGSLGHDSVHYRASAALYALLGDHPVDRRGRCRCCHGLRALLGRRRRLCHVYVAARYYLCQPDDLLLDNLADELEQDNRPPRGGGHASPAPCSRTSAASSSHPPSTQSPQSPAVALPLLPDGGHHRRAAAGSGPRRGRE